MATATLLRQVQKLRRTLAERTPARSPVLDRIRRDPAQILALGGKPPDPWQATLLRSPQKRLLLLNARQTGKSTTAAAIALRTALLKPQALVLLLAPTQRQAAELHNAKVMALYGALGRPIPAVQESAVRIELANRSRIIALPGDERSVRCFSGVDLLVIDEASRTEDGLYLSVRPMLATSGGTLVALSTPFGRRGWFHREWTEGEGWHRVSISAHDCPRISPEFLEEERRSMGRRWFAQEYLNSFESAVDAVFAYEDIQAALTSQAEPLFPVSGR
jgi:hypothetical protein